LAAIVSEHDRRLQQMQSQISHLPSSTFGGQ
jgi:hypothetical protein